MVEAGRFRVLLVKGGKWLLNFPPKKTRRSDICIYIIYIYILCIYIFLVSKQTWFFFWGKLHPHELLPIGTSTSSVIVEVGCTIKHVNVYIPMIYLQNQCWESIIHRYIEDIYRYIDTWLVSHSHLKHPPLKKQRNNESYESIPQALHHHSQPMGPGVFQQHRLDPNVFAPQPQRLPMCLHIVSKDSPTQNPWIFSEISENGWKNKRGFPTTPTKMVGHCYRLT